MFKDLPEGRGNRGLELHGFASHRMRKAEQPRMETEPMERVVTIAVLRVAADGMSHVGRMDAYLVLTSCLQSKLHQGMFRRTVENMEMRDGQFATIIHGR